MTTRLCNLLEGRDKAEARRSFQNQVAHNQGAELTEPLTVFGLNKTILIDDDLPTIIDDMCSFGAEGRAKARFMKREADSAVRACQPSTCSCAIHCICCLPACLCASLHKSACMNTA